MSRARRCLLAWLVSCVSYAGLHQSVQAVELISAEQVLMQQALSTRNSEAHAHLLQWLDRGDVAAMLVERGVNLEHARARVAALTDVEAAALMAEIDRAPAGASELLGTLVLVFVLLVFSDLLGFTRIFPFLRPAR